MIGKEAVCTGVCMSVQPIRKVGVREMTRKGLLLSYLPQGVSNAGEFWLASQTGTASQGAFLYPAKESLNLF